MSLMDYETSQKNESTEADLGYTYLSVDSELICPLCNKIMEDPHQLIEDCGCIFCFECVKKLLNTETSCPKCQEALINREIYKDHSLRNEIKNLEVKCTTENCTWIGKAHEHKSHCEDVHSPVCEYCFNSEKHHQHIPNSFVQSYKQKPIAKFINKKEMLKHCENFIVYHMIVVFFNILEKKNLLEKRIQNFINDEKTNEKQSISNTVIKKTESDVKTSHKRKNPSTSSVIFSKKKIDYIEKKIKDKLEPIENRINILQYKYADMQAKLTNSIKENEEISKQSNTFKEQFSGLKLITNELKRGCALNQVKLLMLDEKLLNQERISFNGTLLWKITNVDQRIQDAKSGKQTSFYSPPFYTDKYGYKMCARIYLNGDGNGRNTHLSLFFVILRGENDSLLKWPFRQKVTFILIDQSFSESKENVYDAFRPDPNSSSFKQPITEMNVASGLPVFCPLGKLMSTDHEYIKDNTMFIKILVDIKDLESNETRTS